VSFVEQFVVRVFQGGKVTIPKRVRELLDVEDGDYVRLGVVEVMHACIAGFFR
jgi:AbrB family looped-hinge helix DNA binding protein